MRRQGKLLAFASVRERSSIGVHAKGSADGADGARIAGCANTSDRTKQALQRPSIGQLIAGRMLSNEVGAETAAALLRQLRPGAVISVVRALPLNIQLHASAQHITLCSRCSFNTHLSALLTEIVICLRLRAHTVSVRQTTCAARPHTAQPARSRLLRANDSRHRRSPPGIPQSPQPSTRQPRTSA